MDGWKTEAGVSSLVRTMMDSGLSLRQINIQKYLWVLFHVNVSAATTDGSLWKDGGKGIDFHPEPKDQQDILQRRLRRKAVN